MKIEILPNFRIKTLSSLITIKEINFKITQNFINKFFEIKLLYYCNKAQLNFFYLFV